MLGLTLVFLVGTLWVTGRCFKQRASGHSAMVVQVTTQRPLDIYGVVSSIKKAPPKETGPVDLFRRASVSNDAVYSDSSFPVTNRITIGSGECRLFFYPAFRPLVRSDQRFTETPTGRRVVDKGFGTGLQENDGATPTGMICERGFRGYIASSGNGYVVNNIGWPDTEISQAHVELINVQHLIGAAIAGEPKTLHVRDEQKWPVDVKRGFACGLHLSSRVNELASEDRHEYGGDSHHEIKERLSGNIRKPAADPFPELSQAWRVLIAIASNFIGAGLAVFGIYRGWGLFDSRRRGACFGVGLCLLGCLISLLGQALAWP